MNHYRDPLAGLKSQVETKRAVLASREREVTPLLRALLPIELQGAMADVRPRAFAEGESMEVLSDADAALDALLAAYDQALVMLPRLREADDELPDPPPRGPAPPWLIEEPYLLRLQKALREHLARIDPEARTSRFGDFAYISRFRVDGAPYTFVVAPNMQPDDGTFASYESVLRTPIPKTLPPLRVRRERLHHVVGKALHLVHELELGDPELDQLFWITGSTGTVQVLSAAVRAALLHMADRAPVLELADGIAKLEWMGNWNLAIDRSFPSDAVDVLAAIRDAIAAG